MPYAIVHKALNVGEETAQPGSIIDVSTWAHVDAYVSGGHITLLPEDPDALEALAGVARKAASDMKKQQDAAEKATKKFNKELQEWADAVEAQAQQEADDAAEARQKEYEADHAKAVKSEKAAAKKAKAKAKSGGTAEEAGQGSDAPGPPPAEPEDDAISDLTPRQLKALAKDYDIDPKGMSQEDLEAAVRAAVSSE